MYSSTVELTIAAYMRSKCEPTCIQKSIENSSKNSQMQFLSKELVPGVISASNKPVSFSFKIVGDHRENYLCLHKSFTLIVWLAVSYPLTII